MFIKKVRNKYYLCRRGRAKPALKNAKIWHRVKANNTKEGGSLSVSNTISTPPELVGKKILIEIRVIKE